MYMYIYKLYYIIKKNSTETWFILRRESGTMVKLNPMTKEIVRTLWRLNIVGLAEVTRSRERNMP